MSPPQTFSRNTEFPSPRSEDGESRERLRLSPRRVTTTDTSSPASETDLTNPTTETGSTTAECRLTNRKTTSRGKKKSPGKTFPNTGSCKTSGQGSTSGGRDSLEWWTESSRELSEKLLSRIGTGSVDLRSISWNGSVNDRTVNSWYRTRSSNLPIRNSQKISWPSFTSSLAGTTEGDVTRARKIRLSPTSQQVKILRGWMEDYRKTWNMALKLVKEQKRKISLGLKKDVVTRRASDGEKLKALKSSPANIRKGAVNDLVKANRSSWALYRAKLKESKKNWRKTPFEIRYKSKKATSGSLEFEKKDVKKTEDGIELFSHPKFKMTLKANSSDIPEITKDCRITRVFDRWYLVVPEVVSSIKRPPVEEPKVIGIDPGLRTAFSCFGTDGKFFEFGCEVKSKVHEVNNKLEGIKVKMRNSTTKRSRLKKSWYRHMMRAKHLCDELQWKTINFLTTAYDVIVLGKLNVKSLMMSHNKENKRMLSFLSFYKFRQRLEEKSKVRGNIVVIQNEAGTTQGCPKCGFKKLDVGTNKVFKCDRCDFVGDRDLKSAICMILKCCS